MRDINCCIICLISLHSGAAAALSDTDYYYYPDYEDQLKPVEVKNQILLQIFPNNSSDLHKIILQSIV